MPVYAKAYIIPTIDAKFRKPRDIMSTLWLAWPIRIHYCDVRNPHVSALNRQIRIDFGVLFCHDLFHDCAPLDSYVINDSYLSIRAVQQSSVNRPLIA